MKNRILDNAVYQAAFIDWAKTHYRCFNCYPESFIITPQGGAEIDFAALEVREAIENLVDVGILSGTDSDLNAALVDIAKGVNGNAN